ncbi:MAG: glycosyltransferase [Lachnospiraceae bacterium]|nr:glycosyltransferase [Lachnospiraceae bacterium]
MVFLKQSVKQLLVNRQHKRYQKEVVKKNLTYYDAWIRAREEKFKIASNIVRIKRKKTATEEEPFGQIEVTDRRGKKQIYNIVSVDIFDENRELVLERYITDAIIFTMYGGEISDIALPLIDEVFRENGNVSLIYGDEDIWNGEVREKPWFKPDWSPDTFLDAPYFGGLIVIRTTSLKEAYMQKPDAELYTLIFDIIRKHGGFEKGHDMSVVPVYHIPQVLFHVIGNGTDAAYNNMRYSKFRGAAGQQLQPSAAQETFISIIIPSKDNPETLFKCLDSLLERTLTHHGFEVILVDNGSKEENRRKIEERINQLNCRTDYTKKGFSGCRYIYNPMPFNFSIMCNMGAEESKGELLLFLNDDMEIIQPDWLDKLSEKAVLSYAGAVGAKLLYPDSNIIQHAGITNLRVGPAHKLQFLSDEEAYYFGKNRGVHNMLAVTGACLMVRRSVFNQADGFPQELAVAFNDVDLCYSIYEQGYYNIVRNDVILYHHESLSRGHDGESEEKQMRLMREKDVLYERHRELYGKDPFYHPYLATDRLEIEYTLEYDYHMLEDMQWAKARIDTKNVENAREDKCLVVGMECALDIYKWKYGVSREKGRVQADEQDMGYFFQGYSFVIGADNACYKKKLLLKNKENESVLSIPVENRYRQDIKNNLKDQLNVDLTGFAAKVPSGRIPAGIYRFGIMAEDMCSRQKLVNWSSWVLEVKDGL